jgi:excisionase family DNA binding protein
MEKLPPGGPGVSRSLLSPHGAAEALGISVPTIYRLVERRAIAFVRVGGRLRFRPEDIDRYVITHRVQPLHDIV